MIVQTRLHLICGGGSALSGAAREQRTFSTVYMYMWTPLAAFVSLLSRPRVSRAMYV